MGIEILPIGGYGEVGKNMTAVKVDDDVVIFDMGLHLPNYIKYTEEESGEIIKLSAQELRKVKAIPDDSILGDWKKKVVAIIPTHAHLDHIGALPYMANNYNAPIICTPYTAAVLKAILRDEKIVIENKIIEMQPNSKMMLAKDIELEFINITHSIPQTVLAVLHTPHGCILYGNDFKLDNNPVLGKKPEYERLEKIGEHGITAAIIDTLYASEAGKTPSESVAREMLKEVMLGTDSRGKAVIITTFSSHIARLKSIMEFGLKMNRKIVMMGRSLAKYVNAASEAGITHFEKDAEIIGFGKKVKRKLREIERKGPEKYLMIVTGHQGEPKSTLSKMASRIFNYKFKPEDHVIFSCKVIPTQVNRICRQVLEQELAEKGVRLFKDVHVSGHSYKEDLREFVKMTKPKHVIPAHSEKPSAEAFIKLAEEMGYKKGKDAHHLSNGEKLVL